MKARPVLISLLLFGSGISALIYQTVWLREFRLIFGSAAAASAAVLAIFLAGLGAGSMVVGHKVDKKPRRPVRFFALLQLFITISAAASPFLLELVRAKYILISGVTGLGLLPATGLRLALSLVVLVVPAFLLGGTLPAASRIAETETDSKRRKIALAYGAYLVGAAAGVTMSTFYLLEHFGNQITLWLACGLNLLVSLVAFAVFLASHPIVPPKSEQVPENETTRTPVTIVLLAATIPGFVFVVMQLVWYRMLAPLLGGSTFTAGLILALTFLGIALGSLAYAFFGWEDRPRLSTFTLTCAAEAFFIAAPYALGDRIAVLTLLLRPFAAFGFCGQILAWSQIGAILILPAAFFAGLQFPMLIALLGRGRERIGWHVGLVYTCNVVGAIAASLVGGFGLFLFLSATDAWKSSVLVLSGVGAILWIASLIKDRRVFSLVTSVLLTAAAVLMLCLTGPTSAWRQSPVGAGRGEGTVTSPNAKEEWLRSVRRYISYQTDAAESCLGISIGSGVSFSTNGNSEGHGVSDASTQVMIGLLGAILQPHTAHALVLGLGSGSTAGWLGDIASMERVDVVELERAMLKVAQVCAPANRNVLANPKVHIRIGDPRDALLTTLEQYDLVISEPWSPDRAGVASFYTREYYDAAARRLRPGGLFLQFVPAYEVDSSTIRSIFKTFVASFSKVETWQTNGSDLLFVGSMEPVRYDTDALRLRIAQEPFKTALAKIWRITDVEGFVAHYVANDSFSRRMASYGKIISNTDDRNAVEFAFARPVGKSKGFEISQLREAAHRQGEDRPAITGTVDWTNVIDENATVYTSLGQAPPAYSFLDSDQRRRLAAQSAYVDENVTTALQLWQSQPRDAQNLTEYVMMAELFAAVGDESALKYIEKVVPLNSGEASMLLALLRFRQGRAAEATDALESAFASLRTDPWAMPLVATHSLSVAEHISNKDRGEALSPRIYRALEKPFALNVAESSRRKLLLFVAADIDQGRFSEYSHKAIAAFEPNVPWDRDFLQVRRDCYRALSDPRAETAAQELAQYLANDSSLSAAIQ